jgi:adenylate kinase
MRIVIMGVPGVGKGTQATALRDHLGVPHVSTGDILREAVRAGSVLGRRVKDVLDSGQLVPDGLMGEMIVERLSQNDARGGFILDGFPRTREQVTILDGILERLQISLDGVYVLTAPEEEIVRRLGGRRVCPKCSAVYHIETKAPASPGVCDACSSALVQRADDTEAVIRDRLRVYAEQTMPVVESFGQRGLLRELDASGPPETIAARLKEAVGTS